MGTGYAMRTFRRQERQEIWANQSFGSLSNFDP